MRIADYCDWVAIEKLSELCPDGDMVDVQTDGLGRSLKESVKSVLKKTYKTISKPIKSAARAHRKFQKRVFQKVAPERLQKYVSRLGKKGRGWLVKAGPFASLAANLLNFLIPGLGVAVSLAISAVVTAVKISDANKMKRHMKKAEKQAEKDVQAEVAEADKKAEEALNAAYDKGAELFVEDYGMTKEKFMALPMEEKSRFFNVVIYDQHTENMVNTGVTRDAFKKMPLAEQMEALANMAQALPGSPGTFDAEKIAKEAPPEGEAPADPSMAPTFAPTAFRDEVNPWIWVAAGVAVFGGAYFVYRKVKG